MNTRYTDWEWVADGRFPMFCLTITRGRTAASVLSAYGVEAGTESLLTLQDTYTAFPPRDGGTVLRSGALSRWVYCYEDREPEGFKPGVLGRLSEGTETISVFKSGDGLASFEYWREGHRTEGFEPGRPAVERGDGSINFSDAVREEKAAAAGGVLPLQAALLVTGRYVGGVLEREALEGPLVTAFLSDVERQPLRVHSTPMGQELLPGLGRRLPPVGFPATTDLRTPPEDCARG